MRRILAWTTVAVALALLLAEATMQPSARDRALLIAVFVFAGISTVGLYRFAARRGSSFASVGTLLAVVAISSVAITAVAVALAAQTMFLSPHDRNLVFVALLLGVALGVALSVAYSRSISADLGTLGAAARAVEAGDLGARVAIDRADEIGMAARAFDSMAERLQAVSDERRLLLTSISHDLRTPLASLQAAVEALEDGLAPDPEAYLRGMASDVRHLAGLIDDLFLLAKVESGLPSLSPEPCDLGELVDDAVEAMTPLAAARSVSLSATGSSGPAPVLVDPAAMGRVLRNLIDNAIRHSPGGGTVEIALSDAGFSVSDDGAGFPPELGDSVFDRFVRAEEHRPRGEGAGLGLAIAKGVVEAHGGTIGIGAGPGGQVRVTLGPQPSGR